MKRSRRGGRRPQNNQNGQNGHSNANGGFNPNRVFDSNGPEVKIRGTASHVYEKYLQLARDANASGDRVMAENYLQHAEHYFRIMAAAQAQMTQAQLQAQAAQQAQMQGQMQGQPNGYQSQPSAPRPAGTEDQPFIETPMPTAASSAPSFSLSETAAQDADEEDAAETAEAE